MESSAIVWALCVVALTVRGVMRFEARYADSRLRYAPRAAALLLLFACLVLAAEATGLISLLGSDSDVPHA